MSIDRVLAHRFRETVQRWRLFKAREKLLVAVSGGMDSIVLLDLLLRLSPDLRPHVEVAHFDHHLRGRESAGDVRFVRALCRKWNLPCHDERAPRWKKKTNLQERARKLRYDFFKKVAFRLRIRLVATAHHADDQVENFLMRWLQGAGLKGLGGIVLRSERNGISLVRPLLFFSREEIKAYAKARRLSHREDSSNQKTDYLRNRLRGWLKGLKRENPNLVERTAMNAVFLQADEAWLEGKAEKFFKRLAKKKGSGFRVGLTPYLRLPLAVRYRLLRRMTGAVLSGEAILKVDALLEGENPLVHYDLPGGMRFEKRKEGFEIGRKSSLR